MQTTDATEAILKDAENSIQSLLLGLEEELIEAGLRIDNVDVDTRRFGAMRTTINVRSRT